MSPNNLRNVMTHTLYRKFSYFVRVETVYDKCRYVHSYLHVLGTGTVSSSRRGSCTVDVGVSRKNVSRDKYNHFMSQRGTHVKTSISILYKKRIDDLVSKRIYSFGIL